MLKKTQKVTLFEQLLKLIICSETEMDDSRVVMTPKNVNSHVWPFRKNTAGIPVFYRRHCLGKIQCELSTTLKLSLRPS